MLTSLHKSYIKWVACFTNGAPSRLFIFEWNCLYPALFFSVWNSSMTAWFLFDLFKVKSPPQLFKLSIFLLSLDRKSMRLIKSCLSSSVLFSVVARPEESVVTLRLLFWTTIKSFDYEIWNIYISITKNIMESNIRCLLQGLKEKNPLKVKILVIEKCSGVSIKTKIILCISGRFT